MHLCRVLEKLGQYYKARKNYDKAESNYVEAEKYYMKCKHVASDNYIVLKKLGS